MKRQPLSIKVHVCSRKTGTDRDASLKILTLKIISTCIYIIS